VGDDIDFPSYLVTVDDIAETVPQSPIASEPEARFGTVPRYHAHLGPSGTAQTKASNPVCPVKIENRPPSVGLTRNKMLEINSFHRDGVEADVHSSNMYGIEFETFRERLPCSEHKKTLSLKHEQSIAPQFDACDLPPDSWDEFPAASSAQSYNFKGTESKRSARDIVAMLNEEPSEELFCRSHSLDAPKFQQPKADVSKGFSIWNTGDNDRPALYTVAIPKSVLCDEIGFSTSGSTDWAPVVPPAKKQRLGGKYPLTTMVCNDISDQKSPSRAFSAHSQERSGYVNPLRRGKDVISNVAGPNSKRIIQRNTDPLTFPSADECAEPVSRRNIVVPATFPSWHEYARLFTAAVHEEINLRIREMALMFYKVCQVS
jgi:hypothetical protein